MPSNNIQTSNSSDTTMASLEKLPTELLVMIADLLDPPPPPIPFITRNPSPTDLASLSMVNHQLYGLFICNLYDRYGHLSIPWACQKPCLDTLKAVLRETKNREWVRTCLRGSVALHLVLENKKLVNIDDIHQYDWRKYVGSTPLFDGHITSWIATPLHLACGGGHDDIVEFLLDHGASMEAESKMYCECLLASNYPRRQHSRQIPIPGWLPLHHALCGKHAATALLMLKKGAPVIVSQHAAEDEAPGVTALHMAAAHGQDVVARLLINLWREHPDLYFPLNPDWVDWSNHSPMHYLALNESYSSVITLARMFQEHGINVDFHLGPRSRTPLILACRLGNFTAARALIEVGANPHATDPDGLGCMNLAFMVDYTALDNRRQPKATWELERFYLIKELVKSNALSRFSLSDAARYGHLDDLEFLLNAGVSYIDQLDDEDMTPLAQAAREGHVEVVELLLAKGASVTHFQGSITAAACCADHEPVTGNHAKILEMLLKHGATVGFCCDRNDPIQRKKDYSGSVLDDAMWRIELLPRLRRNERTDSTFDFILQHSTPINFPKACWEQAVFVVLESDDLEVSRATGVILRQLLQFGARFGYVFDDAMLCILMGLLIGKGNTRDLNCFFLMGGPEGVRGETGLVTRKAALFLSMANFHSEVFKWNKPIGVIRYLLEQLPISEGKIRLLGNATLLHLGCCTGDPSIVQLILDSGHCALRELWCAMTPLMLAVAQDDMNVSIQVVRLLLSRDADPYFAPESIGRYTTGMQVPDSLDPGNGKRLSSSIRGMLSELLARHQAWASQQLQLPSDEGDKDEVRPVRLALSAFELAIIKGRSDIITEFLKDKPLVEAAQKRSSSSPQSYLGLAILSRQLECFKILLAAGANINADLECPLLAYQLDRLIATAPTRMEKHRDIDLDWLGQEIAVLILLLKGGAGWEMKSKNFPRSFKAQLRAVVDHDVETSNHRNPHFLVQSVLQEAFTIQRLDPWNGTETLRVNLEDTEKWLDPALSRQSEDWYKWPASWREWKARWTQFISEPS
ncbi:ankyrin repeat-containing domain protein [Cladorrhinum sp. PSN332]|nr:ankyrin repeat-containing domain protein [Cladorrhinum sp. PSN332]